MAFSSVITHSVLRRSAKIIFFIAMETMQRWMLGFNELQDYYFCIFIILLQISFFPSHNGSFIGLSLGDIPTLNLKRIINSLRTHERVTVSVSVCLSEIQPCSREKVKKLLCRSSAPTIEYHTHSFLRMVKCQSSHELVRISLLSVFKLFTALTVKLPIF